MARRDESIETIDALDFTFCVALVENITEIAPISSVPLDVVNIVLASATMECNVEIRWWQTLVFRPNEDVDDSGSYQHATHDNQQNNTFGWFVR